MEDVVIIDSDLTALQSLNRVYLDEIKSRERSQLETTKMLVNTMNIVDSVIKRSDKLTGTKSEETDQKLEAIRTDIGLIELKVAAIDQKLDRIADKVNLLYDKVVERDSRETNKKIRSYAIDKGSLSHFMPTNSRDGLISLLK